jgi:hypothetical protein
MTGTPGTYLEMVPSGTKPNSWVRPSILWRSRNDKLMFLEDPTAATRAAWVAAQLKGSPPAEGLRITGHEKKDEIAFVLAGDTGEGDGSQMAVVPGLLRVGQDTDFMVICSDVIYPTGDANDYLDKFYAPYRQYPGPIYGMPGNHDWYDQLAGFMFHFCNQDQLPKMKEPKTLRHRLSKRLWRKGAPADPAIRDAGRALRPADRRFPSQPGPYWVLDTGPVRLVAIDTGIQGVLDDEQGDWLEEVSGSDDRPKILLTGSPLFVNGERRPCHIGDKARDRTVLKIVRNHDCNYVAVIGGDIHNYQRYPIRRSDGETLQCIVSGGGGAFMHATYKIDKIDDCEDMRDEGLTETDVHLYPARGWSLAELSWALARRRRLASLRLTPKEASVMVSDHLKLDPVVPVEDSVKRRVRTEARFKAIREIFLESRLPGPGRLFQRFVSEFLDSDNPPMFKNFLRVDASSDQVRIRCFRATGFLEDEQHPVEEEEVVIPIGR